MRAVPARARRADHLPRARLHAFRRDRPRRLRCSECRAGGRPVRGRWGAWRGGRCHRAGAGSRVTGTAGAGTAESGSELRRGAVFHCCAAGGRYGLGNCRDRFDPGYGGGRRGSERISVPPEPQPRCVAERSPTYARGPPRCRRPRSRVRVGAVRRRDAITPARTGPSRRAVPVAPGPRVSRRAAATWPNA
jgi:hypothetical protein